MKRLSRPDPVSNRNTMIMANFAKSKIGSSANIFDDLEFPKEVSGKRFSSPAEYYMWEHGWHDLQTYVKAYRRVRGLFGLTTYFDCGSTVAKFQSWGLIEDTRHVMGGVAAVLEKVPEYNQNFNDAKDFITVIAPHFDATARKIRCTYILRHHDDIDPHLDYPSDPHIRGILGQISCVFGLEPASIRQPLLPYDLNRLCEMEPDFSGLDLDPRLEGDILYIRDPVTQKKRALARRVILVKEDPDRIKREIEDAYERRPGQGNKKPAVLDDMLASFEYLCGAPVFLGRYREMKMTERSEYAAFLFQGALATNEVELFPSETIIGAPYFVVNYQSDKEGGSFRSIFYALKYKLKKEKRTRAGLLEALSQVSRESKEKSEAHSTTPTNILDYH